ncbi:MAG: hypothetical protein ACXVAX_02610 [Pseudobdellovibrio sp.]
MNNHFFKILSIIAFIGLTYASCAKKADDSTAPSTGGSGGTTTTALTAAQIAGTHYAPCLPTGTTHAYGTSADNYSFLRALQLNTDLSYSVSVFFFSGTACQAGGTEVFAYSQHGTYALGALTTSPSDATEITYTAASVSSTQLTMYVGTGHGTTGFGAAWATTFNTNCPGLPPNTFDSSPTSTSETSTADVQGITCNGGQIVFDQFPADGSVFKDTITLDSVTSPSTMTVYQSASVFHPGQFVTFPTTATFNYSF